MFYNFFLSCLIFLKSKEGKKIINKEQKAENVIHKKNPKFSHTGGRQDGPKPSMKRRWGWASSVCDASLVFDRFLDILRIDFTSREVPPDVDTSFKLVLLAATADIVGPTVAASSWIVFFFYHVVATSSWIV
jgi:hypothetical protein